MVCTVTDFTHNSCYSCDLIVVFFGASSDAVHIYIQLLSKLSVRDAPNNLPRGSGKPKIHSAISAFR